MTIPSRDVPIPEAARLWGRDRAALVECGDRQAALSDAATALESQGRP